VNPLDATKLDWLWVEWRDEVPGSFFLGRRFVSLRQPFVVALVLLLVTRLDLIHLLHLSLPLGPHDPDDVALDVVVEMVVAAA
jgi:hypothetical protein